MCQAVRNFRRWLSLVQLFDELEELSVTVWKTHLPDAIDEGDGVSLFKWASFLLRTSLNGD
ncbi:hypothetical protein D3C78_1814500 [compost metagenome]